MIRAFQICNGVGSGNVGDELMARAFWDILPEDIQLDVAVLPEFARQHAPYPRRHCYVPGDLAGTDRANPDAPGLLVGDTPVAESEGIGYPLGFVAPRLVDFHKSGLPVDAVGVGVDKLNSAEAKHLFWEAYGPIRSWTVRSNLCRDALLSLGVQESKVRVGADWGWLYSQRRDLREWAADFWRRLGVDPFRPLLVANVVNMIWREEQPKADIAAGIDKAASRFGLQVAFFCNECRDGEFFDFEAAREMAARLKTPSHVVPNHYYSPDEALALLHYATVTVAQRYHFILETVLSNSVSVAILRGQKMRGLAAELDIPVAGSVEEVDPNALVAAIEEALQNRGEFLRSLAQIRQELTNRARNNLSFMQELPPYSGCRGLAAEDGQEWKPYYSDPSRKP